MTDNKVNLTEEKFNRIKNGLNANQLKDPYYFMELSKTYEENDLDLSYRLATHAFRLDNSNATIKSRMTTLRRLLNDGDNQLSLEKIDEIIDQEESNELMRNNTNDNDNSSRSNWLVEKIDSFPAWLKQPFVVFVLIPWFVYALYLVVWASPRYVSQSQIIIEQPNGMATMDPAMAMLSGLGVPNASTDTHLVQAYILSADMLWYLDEQLSLRNHYVSKNTDFFSRLSTDNTSEEFLEFYQNHISVEVDDLSAIIKVNVQAFNANYAQKLNQLVIKRAEWFINSIGHKLAKEQLSFINEEHELVVSKLQTAKGNLLKFQRDNKLLDPEAEGAALQQIAYSLESQISLKKAELKSLELNMADISPEVIATKDLIEALEKQLKEENKRISGDYAVGNVATKLAKFSDYKIDLELALQAYSSSLISLEKSRIEAYRKLQYLVTVQSSTLPDENRYPKVVYNLTLFAIILLLVFGISKILVATIRELN